MDLRPYQPSDRASCLAVFDSLPPDTADAAARRRFEAFLDHPAGPYFLIDHDDAVVGCGGFSLEQNESTATLHWGMIRSDSRKLGLGRFLLLYRIREISKAGNFQLLRVETPPASAPFFQKQGFREKHGFRQFQNTLQLIKKLTVCP